MKSVDGLLTNRNLAAKARCSAFLCLLFVFVQVLATVPALHEYFHPDSASPTHSCAVTCLAHGQVELSSGAVMVAEFLPVISFTAGAPSTLVFSAETLVLPGRGPPQAA
jgi:hypothetical protein